MPVEDGSSSCHFDSGLRRRSCPGGFGCGGIRSATRAAVAGSRCVPIRSRATSGYWQRVTRAVPRWTRVRAAWFAYDLPSPQSFQVASAVLLAVHTV